MAHDIALRIDQSVETVIAKGLELQFQQLSLKGNTLTPAEKIQITENLIERLAAIPKQGDPKDYNDFLYDENGLPH